MKSQFLKLLAGALIIHSANVMGTPVTFKVDSVTLTPGAGYGQDTSETNGTLLDVGFSANSFVPTSFSLSAVDTSWTFLVSRLTLAEPVADNSNNDIKEQETRLLNVTAAFTFASPLAGERTVSATGTAIKGSIVDADVDYSLSWTALTDIAFGNRGLFDISLNTINFSNFSQEADLFATVTLRQLPTVLSLATASVPEPGTLALIALALALTGWTTRRRREMNT